MSWFELSFFKEEIGPNTLLKWFTWISEVQRKLSLKRQNNIHCYWENQFGEKIVCECVWEIRKWIKRKEGKQRDTYRNGEGGQPLFQSSVMSISVSRNQHCLGVYWSRESQLHIWDQNPNYLTIFTLWNSGGTSKKLAQRIEYCTFKLPLFGEFCCYTIQFFHDVCKIPIVD